MKKRKFSVPYNGDSVVGFINYLLKYKENIENIFLGIPSLENNHYTSIISSLPLKKLVEYENNCLEFLKMTKGQFKRILTLNSGNYNLSDQERKLFVLTRLNSLIKSESIDGIILTDFNMAKFIHQEYPDLELHTSCNCFQWNIKQMNYWREEAGITVFNPPREILRTPNKLKEMKEEGFILKCLINESCLYGCPQTINHCMSLSNGKPLSDISCCNGNLSNFLKSNWVLPRWLDFYDQYVDIYKISGRNDNTEKIFKTLDCYLNSNDNVNILDILVGGTSSKLKAMNLNIQSQIIPDILMYCECKECNKTCFICKNLADKYLAK